ncbi:putative two-component system sensor kinase [Actinacidiphila reveromycinica]|uniref:Putative two-component system sensor kinase n=1 Tax=Actinacidiphila reveromycinica TaxID=659352 RepID=A0A7U3UN59_9ACTN|nr:putative two-component system sensor kinase [Streptomyces sp. SN-593]
MGNSLGDDGRRPGRELDHLLDEMQARADAVAGTRARVHGLLEALLTVGGELDLSQVLRRIVESAVTLVDAEYGALGVIEGTRLSEFLTVGVSEEQAGRIGALPSGHGILGELIRRPQPLRLSELSAHPSSYGFPPDHPPMRSFLGVPIRVRDEVFGNLYLTEKRGGADFDAEDETILRMLAVAAGVAIENARLYQAARDRQRWLEANAQIVRALLSGAPQAEVLEGIVGHAGRILNADLGVLALPVTGSADLRVAIALGVDADAHRDLVLPVDGSFMGAALATGEQIATADIQQDPRVTAGPPRWSGLGPVVAVPMVTDDGVRGVLLLARKERAAPFSEEETAPLLAFAGQAALAMELAARRRDAEQVAVLEDRDRIARDLHDMAIQRLFATGMTLQSTLRFVDHPQATERIMRAVDDLDETIKIIRTTIFGLRAREAERRGGGLRFTPSLQMEGPIDAQVPAAIAEEAVAVLDEALSNVARHAEASSVLIRLTVAAGTLTLTVRDDGVGIAPDAPRGGLRNLAERADGLGGTFHVGPAPDGGTRLRWSVPLEGPGAG